MSRSKTRRLFDETQRLLKETEDRAAELAIINSVQKGLASKLEMQAIYDLVGDKIRDIFRTEVVYIAVLNANKADQIDFPYYLDRGKRLSQEPIAIGRGITSQVILSRQPLVAGTMQQQLDLGGIYDNEEQSQSYLGVPIFLGDLVIGVASVQSYQPNAFSDTDIRLLSTLAASMGVALENARLFDETNRRARETAALAEVGHDISSTLDLSTVMDRIAGHAKDLLNADTSAIFLPDSTGQIYQAIVAIGDVAEELKVRRHSFGRGHYRSRWQKAAGQNS